MLLIACSWRFPASRLLYCCWWLYSVLFAIVPSLWVVTLCKPYYLSGLAPPPKKTGHILPSWFAHSSLAPLTERWTFRISCAKKPVKVFRTHTESRRLLLSARLLLLRIFYPEYKDTLFLPSFFETYKALSAWANRSSKLIPFRVIALTPRLADTDSPWHLLLSNFSNTIEFLSFSAISTAFFSVVLGTKTINSSPPILPTKSVFRTVLVKHKKLRVKQYFLLVDYGSNLSVIILLDTCHILTTNAPS